VTKPFDPLALRIGRAYRCGLAAYAEAGRLLADKKATLKHGEWLPWIKANADALGFDADRTAQRLIKLAAENPTLTTDLPDEQKAITARLWGNVTRRLWRPPTSASGENLSSEWYSQTLWPDMSRRVFDGGKIALDPASCAEANRRVRAKQFYTLELNGLTRDWKGSV
jgi:hypothetical protein